MVAANFTTTTSLDGVLCLYVVLSQFTALLAHHLLAVLDDDALVGSVNLLAGEVVDGSVASGGGLRSGDAR